FAKNVGFYRPLVAVTFSADHAVWGLRAVGYALTNLTVCLADTLLLYALARRLGIAAAGALVAAALWALNPHAINMALLWTGGREGEGYPVLRRRAARAHPVGGLGPGELCHHRVPARPFQPLCRAAVRRCRAGGRRRRLACLARRRRPLRPRRRRADRHRRAA